MKFSTQNLLSLRDWQTHAEVYADALAECRLADELGFHTVWLAEHHFSHYGICPSLAPLAAAIARETRRARIGTAVVIAPFEHPVRIAEEWAEIDILSGGRLEFGLGRGYQPKEFEGLGVSMEGTRERFDEALDVIRGAWTEDRLTFEGAFYRVPGVRVLPKPVQRPHPPRSTSSARTTTRTSPSGGARAAPRSGPRSA
jgi:alkanesulfonate monooxygenase SsuD/methylene tetrahydromethanopterin reductase-like flavin-dependent oxidoreductase (luciferase family)